MPLCRHLLQFPTIDRGMARLQCRLRHWLERVRGRQRCLHRVAQKFPYWAGRSFKSTARPRDVRSAGGKAGATCTQDMGFWQLDLFSSVGSLVCLRMVAHHHRARWGCERIGVLGVGVDAMPLRPPARQLCNPGILPSPPDTVTAFLPCDKSTAPAR